MEKINIRQKKKETKTKKKLTKYFNNSSSEIQKFLMRDLWKKKTENKPINQFFDTLFKSSSLGIRSKPSGPYTPNLQGP